MLLDRISLAHYITGKLRQNMTDYNASNRASQFGQWIYPDRPKIMKLLNDKDNFPRISVESVSTPSNTEIGMSCPDLEETGTLRINVWAPMDLVCDIKTTSEEVHSYTDGTSGYTLNNLPLSTITLVTGTLGGVPHTFIKNTDYTIMDSDSDGFFDSVEWLSGNTPDNATDFKISYKRIANGTELCRIISQDINKYLRENWRLWDNVPLWSYKKIADNPVDLDTEMNLWHHELQIQFTGINIGEEI